MFGLRIHFLKLGRDSPNFVHLCVSFCHQLLILLCLHMLIYISSCSDVFRPLSFTGEFCLHCTLQQHFPWRRPKSIWGTPAETQQFRNTLTVTNRVISSIELRKDHNQYNLKHKCFLGPTRGTTRFSLWKMAFPHLQQKSVLRCFQIQELHRLLSTVALLNLQINPHCFSFCLQQIRLKTTDDKVIPPLLKTQKSLASSYHAHAWQHSAFHSFT